MHKLDTAAALAGSRVRSDDQAFWLTKLPGVGVVLTELTSRRCYSFRLYQKFVQSLSHGKVTPCLMNFVMLGVWLACIYFCLPCACVLPFETRRRHWLELSYRCCEPPPGSWD